MEENGTTAARGRAPARAGGWERVKAYGELTKPRLVLMIVLVALAAFCMASPSGIDWVRLATALVGIGLLAAGILALNEYAERDTDLLMARTAGRPVPSGRLGPREALAFGAVSTAASLVLIALRLGWVAGLVGLFTFASYVLVYTPLKRRTALHTVVGAFSGAMPPLLGWAAARGTLDRGALILGGMLFLWQFPHFLAIGSMYGEDYARGGIRTFPSVETRRGWITAVLIAASLAGLLAASIGPWVTGLDGPVYLAGALAAGAGFVATAVLLLARRTKRSARVVLRASVIYLPLVFALMVFDAAR